ncbi:MAG: recombinase RecA [Rhodopseudomonas palustris]|nr:MAG: recombinase RecA [Rhodopseudomonas palustris]
MISAASAVREIDKRTEAIRPKPRLSEAKDAADPLFDPITPACWRGTSPPNEQWLAQDRVLSGDVTILSGNGGCGKTEIATSLLVAAASEARDWLGSIVEPGPALFISCEESEENIRSRVERICEDRGIDPFSLDQLHLFFPELDATWLVSADHQGKVARTPLLDRIEGWIARYRPVLVVIDSVTAVFDADAINRRQVRAFVSILRKIAREHGTAVLLLDHPSQRGMADGSGTANSVDWRNSVRGMMYLSDPLKNDPDTRILEISKTNRTRAGEKVALHWNGQTFTKAASSSGSPHLAAAEREIDELFLRLLDKRNGQGRPVRPSTGRGFAPGEFEKDPDAKGVKAPAFRRAMERLFTQGRIIVEEQGPQSKRVKHIKRSAVA